MTPRSSLPGRQESKTLLLLASALDPKASSTMRSDALAFFQRFWHTFLEQEDMEPTSLCGPRLLAAEAGQNWCGPGRGIPDVVPKD